MALRPVFGIRGPRLFDTSAPPGAARLRRLPVRANNPLATVRSGCPAEASPVQSRALGVLKRLLCAGVHRGDTALHRHKRRVTIPRVRSGKSSIAEVLCPPLHLEHVGGREPFEPIAFDGMSGIPLLTQYWSVGWGHADGARVPDDLQIDLVAVAGVHVDVDAGEAAAQL